MLVTSNPKLDLKEFVYSIWTMLTEGQFSQYSLNLKVLEFKILLNLDYIQKGETHS